MEEHKSNENRLMSENSELANFTNSIDKEINKLLNELNSRNQQSKIMSIQDNLKLLYRRMHSMQNQKSKASPSPNNESSFFSKVRNSNDKEISGVLSKRITKSKDDLAGRLKELEYENKNLSDELKKYKSALSQQSMQNLDKRISDLERDNQNLRKRSENLQYNLKEEQAKNTELILHAKNLEDALKKLNMEYNSLSYRFAKLNSESESFEKTINKLKDNLKDNRAKAEELMQINQELKEKHFEKEAFLDTHSKDLRQALQKNIKLNSRVEGLEHEKANLEQELKYKEERLKAVRAMNSKLESQSQKIIKKWESVKTLEEKTDEMNKKILQYSDMINDQNSKIVSLKQENVNLAKSELAMKAEYEKVLQENESLKQQVNGLKNTNSAFEKNLTQFENKFKEMIFSPELMNAKPKRAAKETKVNFHESPNYSKRYKEAVEIVRDFYF